MGLFTKSRNDVDDSYQRSESKGDHFLKKRNMHYLMAFLYLAVVIASGIIVNDKLNEVALIEEAEAYQPVLNL